MGWRKVPRISKQGAMISAVLVLRLYRALAIISRMICIGKNVLSESLYLLTSFKLHVVEAELAFKLDKKSDYCIKI